MSNIINILVALDTDKLKRSFPPNPGQSADAPTDIDHTFGYMVASGVEDNSITGQGTGDLSFNAFSGDVLRVFGASGSDNFEDAVLIYDMPCFGGDQVLSKFEYQRFPKSAIVPGGEDPLPFKNEDQTFWFFEANVNTNKGKEQYRVQFGLYTRNAGQQTLYGYFRWDPTISVAG